MSEAEREKWHTFLTVMHTVHHVYVTARSFSCFCKKGDISEANKCFKQWLIGDIPTL